METSNTTVWVTDCKITASRFAHELKVDCHEDGIALDTRVVNHKGAFAVETSLRAQPWMLLTRNVQG